MYLFLCLSKVQEAEEMDDDAKSTKSWDCENVDLWFYVEVLGRFDSWTRNQARYNGCTKREGWARIQRLKVKVLSSVSV